MRALRLVLLAVACVSVVALAGCSKDDEVNKQVEDLTKKVEALEKAVVIDDLTKKVEALEKAVVIDADGNARLATATPVSITDYKQYGFGLPIPANIEVTASGLTGNDASNDSGSLLASAGGTSLLLVWNKATPPLTPQESVIGAFNVLQSLTQAEFETVGAGDGLTVDAQPGVYGTFVTRDTRDTIDGVGIIGGWVCPNDKRSYAITVTGKDLEPVQQSFIYLTNGFSCESGKTQTAPPPTPTATATATATATPTR